MSADSQKSTLRDLKSASPASLSRNDAFAVQLVAVVLTGGRWTCYSGSPIWSSESVLAYGDQVTYEEAGMFHYLMRNLTYSYG